MKRKVYFVTIIYSLKTENKINIYQKIDKESKSGMAALVMTSQEIKAKYGETKEYGNTVTELTPSIFKIEHKPIKK